MIIEPRGSTWTEDANSRASATVTPPGGAAFREFVLLFQNDVNLRFGNGAAVPNTADAEDPEDSGQKALNYRTEPMWKRLGFAPDTPLEQTRDVIFTNALTNALVGGDPVTPVFTATRGTPVRFRILHPAGHPRNEVFQVHGHIWEEEPYVSSSMVIGSNPAGNQLAAVMPKYRMSREDLADLIAYLKRLTDDRDPGITETTVKVGTLLPMTGPLAEIGGVAKAVITGYFNDINDGGGIYNRRLELHVADAPDASSIGAHAKRLVEDGQVFCLAGAFTAGADDGAFALMKSAETPLVGPFTLFPRTGFPLNRHVFYLFSGLKEQARTLANFLVETKRARRLALVYSQDRDAEVLEAIDQHCQKAGCSSVTTLRYARGQFDAERTVERLRRENAEALFLFGLGAEEKTLLKEIEKTGWRPYVVLPGSLAGGDVFDLPASFNGKVLLSFPTLPSDRTEAGLAEYRAFAQKHKLPARHLAVQLSSYCAAKLLAHGMKQAGKDLSSLELI